MIETFHHGFSSGGVTLFQCWPPSVVNQINPSSVPAQRRSALKGEGASAYTTPRCTGLAVGLSAYLPTFAGTSYVLRVKSPLIWVQLLPPSSVLKTMLAPKNNRCGL